MDPQDLERSYPRSHYELGWIARDLFRHLGVEVGPSAVRGPVSLLTQLLPPTAGRGLSLAIHSGIRNADGRRGSVSVADEVEWLAANLRLEALRETDPADALHHIWSEACDACGIDEADAEVDTARLAHEMLHMASATDHHEIALRLGATLRTAGSPREARR